MNWDHLRLVLAVGRAGSLAGAGRALGIDQTTVGRRLAAAERAFGGRLFLRADGRLLPTEGCRALLVRAERMEAEADAAVHALSEVDRGALGPVRVTAVESLIIHLLVSLADGLRTSLPHVQPVFLPAERTLDLARRQADIALRLARPTESRLKVRRLAEVGFAVYAAPGGSEGWLAYDEARADLPEGRWLADRLETGPLSARTPVLRIGSVPALAEAAARGLGRAVLPCYLGDGHYGLRRLEGPVLARELWMAVHEELGRVPRVRAVADWLAGALSKDGLRARLAGTA